MLNREFINTQSTEFFREDRYFSKIYSANIDDVIEFLRKSGLSELHGWVMSEGPIIVPKITCIYRLQKQEIQLFLNLMKLISQKFKWRLRGFSIKGVIACTDQNKLKSFLEMNVSGDSNYLFELTPDKYCRDLIDDTEYIESSDYLYHVTSRANLNSIKQRGLIPTSNSRTRFQHPSCIHLLRYLGGLVKISPVGSIMVPIELRIPYPMLLKIGPLKGMNEMYFMIDPSSPVDGLVTPNKIAPSLISLVTDPVSEFRIASINHSTKKLEDMVFSNHSDFIRRSELTYDWTNYNAWSIIDGVV